MTRIARIIGLGIGGLLWLTTIGCQPGEGISPGGYSAEDEYTLLLKMWNGGDHMTAADYYLQRTKQYTNWRGLYVVNKDTGSALYWGKYRTRQDALNNLQTAKQYRAPATKEHIYQMAAIVPLPGKDVGPPEWNLKNADGEYTVLVAVFQNIPRQHYFGRKNRAVELCKKLRDRGEDAYYMHDIARSIVTIGMFPASSVQTRRIQKRHPQTGDTYFEDFRVVVDPNMKAILKDNPELLYCGNTEIRTEVDRNTGKLVQRVSPSVPLNIAECLKGDNSDAFNHAGNP
jgi:hypothetical protein